MKMAPIHKAFQTLACLPVGRLLVTSHSSLVTHLICHTGQHYDEKMSEVFFNDLELPKPDFYLGVGSGSHAEQTAKVMIEFEKVLIQEKPDLIMVYGDVNSTVACSLVAAKMGIKIAHVESGLRSFDRSMPEEINRIVTDHLSDYLFVTEKSGVENLKKEGICNDKIFFVGNTMIDSLIDYLPKAEQSHVLANYNLQPRNYILVTLHRPSNVDDEEKFRQVFDLLNKLSVKRKIIFPVHPRTMKVIEKLAITVNKSLILTGPIGYIDFLTLMNNAEVVITDSGGIQEETTYLGVQCITVRDNTERPITIEVGTNNLIGKDFTKVEETYAKIFSPKFKNRTTPKFWDGKAANRITVILSQKRIEITNMFFEN